MGENRPEILGSGQEAVPPFDGSTSLESSRDDDEIRVSH